VCRTDAENIWSGAPDNLVRHSTHSRRRGSPARKANSLSPWERAGEREEVPARTKVEAQETIAQKLPLSPAGRGWRTHRIANSPNSPQRRVRGLRKRAAPTLECGRVATAFVFPLRTRLNSNHGAQPARLQARRLPAAGTLRANLFRHSGVPESEDVPA
jgi:hypothetical protein